MGDFMVSSGVVHLNDNAGGFFIILFCCVCPVMLYISCGFTVLYKTTYHELRYALVIVLKQLFENTLAVKTMLKLNTKSK